MVTLSPGRGPKVKGEQKAAAELRNIRRLVKLCGPSPFGSFEMFMQDSGCYFRLDHILGLLEVMRTTDFEPCRGYVPGKALWADQRADSIASGGTILSPNQFYLGGDHTLVTGKAVAMGRSAREEGWSKAKLEERFAEFLEKAQTVRVRGPHDSPSPFPEWWTLRSGMLALRLEDEGRKFVVSKP
jgi:hypothetical protein